MPSMTINGEAVETADTFAVVDPATGEAFAQASACSRDMLPTAPFGGSKWSGIGVEDGTDGLMAFTEAQTVHVARTVSSVVRE